ncbi:MAG: arginine--tRNA ligase [Pirellulales bacterium]
MSALRLLRQRFVSALHSWVEEGGQSTPDREAARKTLPELVLPSKDARFGDYQSECPMKLGKELGLPPRQVAEQLIECLEVDDFCEPPTIAGPGFINMRLKDSWLVQQLQQAVVDEQRLGVQPSANPRTVVVDYSGPNVAKPMHVGHIRSTVIGAAICRVLKFLGHQTISDNHLGDWGTQFGMIIYGYKHFVDEEALQKDTVTELSRLYKLVNGLIEYHDGREQQLPALNKKIAEQQQKVDQAGSALVTGPASVTGSAPVTGDPDPKQHKKEKKRLRQAKNQLADLIGQQIDLCAKLANVDDDPQRSAWATAHPEIRAAALAETAALHQGDATNVALWNRFLPPCLAEIDKIYVRLGVVFDYTYGESFYHDQLAGVVASLTEKGLVRESDGAKCVFLETHQAPFIVQKQDGAYLYATTDLATIQYRMRQWSPDAILYVVDHRQSLHFQQLIATAYLWAYPGVELQHISFGTVLGKDGKPYKTRSGDTVGLSGLLDEAVNRAHAIVSANDDARPKSLLSADERAQVAEQIGIGAIKYADLAHNRTSDYVFSYDKMLAMTGNTAAYMQYSYARVRSIFSRGGVDACTLRISAAPILLDSLTERNLAVALLQFSEALDRLVEDYRPNHLTSYLFQLASRYSEFFEHCPVLKANSDEQRNSRLLLCDLTARTIRQGLHLLGIAVVERM